ncbi:MAG: hypothetical protein AB8B58_17240 [Roseobacter sp.]
MAYQDVSNPAYVLSREITATRNFLTSFGRWFASLGQSVTFAHMARQRFEAVSLLQGKSDEELARLGLKREEIARRVFQDLYYS